MTTNLIPFTYQDQPVRVIDVDGQPWFVLADLCRVLDIANPRDTAQRVPPESVGTADVLDARGVSHPTNIVDEPGMYEVVFLSRKHSALAFRRWITTEVLPSIRKTGGYGTPQLSGPELMARALIEAQRTLRDAELRALKATQEVRQLAPKAGAWDSFLTSTGDYSVNEAAKILTRDRLVHTGEKRLRALLEEWGWIYRHSGVPRAMQAQVDLGRLTEKARFHYHPTTGEKVADAPQVRITPKGLDAIYQRMTRGTLLEVP